MYILIVSPFSTTYQVYENSNYIKLYSLNISSTIISISEALRYCYHPQGSCGKVMFSLASVILFTGGVSVPAFTTGHMTWGSLFRGVSVQGGFYLGDGGLCPGVSLSGEGSLSRGVSVWGVCPGGYLGGGGLCPGGLSPGEGGLCPGVSVWGVSV